MAIAASTSSFLIGFWQFLQMLARPEEERAAKQKETADERKKKLKAIPLTDDQIKAVDDFYEEMRRNRPQRGGGQ